MKNEVTSFMDSPLPLDLVIIVINEQNLQSKSSLKYSIMPNKRRGIAFLLHCCQNSNN